MLFCIFGIDKPNMGEVRAKVMPAHVEYLGAAPIKLVMSAASMWSRPRAAPPSRNFAKTIH